MNNNNPSSNPMGHIVVIASMCLVSNASFPFTSRFAWLSYIIGPAPLKRAHNQCNKRIVVHGIFLPSTNHPLLLPCSALLCSASLSPALSFQETDGTSITRLAAPWYSHRKHTREKKRKGKYRASGFGLSTHARNAAVDRYTEKRLVWMEPVEVLGPTKSFSSL